jgi:ribose transport system substrate-binding protein
MPLETGNIIISENNNYTIYLITKEKQGEFWENMNRGSTDMAKLIGVNYIWNAPQERDVDEQIQIFNKAVEEGADAIMLAASDPVRISDAVKEAKAKGVKIIYVDAPANEEAIVTLATDNYNAGRIAGNIMLSELEASGIQNGSIGIIGVSLDNLTTMNREKGFRDVISEDARFEILNTQYTEGNVLAAEKATNILIEENRNLVSILSTDEGNSVGLGNAIKTNKARLIGIGFDFNNEIHTMIRNNILKAVLVQNPYTMGYLGMAETIAALEDYETGPAYINTGVSILNRYTLARNR